ncbi:hypothetical protein DDE19_07570 [Micromonospora ureilytica]|uniref:Uncharacterized protein n=1 Tax=Micromonospora ureilytica TaxID=709868 RepID=A0A3N9Y015_9ACTN|nr:hypothetical protein DDE19_07570 [Micromonospora ureilytica]
MLGAPLLVLSGAGLGAVVTVVSLLPGAVGLTAAVAVLCAGAFLLWPWAVLPVGIIGGALLSGGDVGGYLAVNVLLLAVGGAALAVRHRRRCRSRRGLRHRRYAHSRYGVGYRAR